LLNKSIHLFKKNTDPKLLNGGVYWYKRFLF